MDVFSMLGMEALRVVRDGGVLKSWESDMPNRRKARVQGCVLDGSSWRARSIADKSEAEKSARFLASRGGRCTVLYE